MIFDVSEAAKLLYLILPGIIANMTPVLVAKIKFLNYPVDFGLKINGERVFGENKTLRGVFFAVIAAIIVAFIQKIVNLDIHLISYDNFVLIGFLLGLGAMLGDLVESFIKRRFKINPGKAFIPFDQIDHIIGALILISIFYPIPFVSAVWIVVCTTPIHMLINFIAFKLKLRKDVL